MYFFGYGHTTPSSAADHIELGVDMLAQKEFIQPWWDDTSQDRENFYVLIQFHKKCGEHG